MAIAYTALDSDQSGTNGTSFTTASVTPTSNELVLIAIWGEAVTENNDGYPTSVTSGGLTWVKIAHSAGDTFSDASLWRALGASPTSGVITMTFANDQTGVNWSVIECSGIDTGGTNGSAAIVQSAVTEGGSGTALSVTLAAFGSVNNATFGTFGAYIDTTNTITHSPGTGFTEIHDISGDFGDGWRDSLYTEFRNDNDTTVTATMSQASDAYGGIAIEIKEAVAGGATGKSNPLSGIFGGPLAGPIG